MESKIIKILLIGVLLLIAANFAGNLYFWTNKDETATKMIENVRDSLNVAVRTLERTENQVSDVIKNLNSTRDSLMNLRSEINAINENYEAAIAISNQRLRNLNSKWEKEKEKIRKLQEKLILLK